MAAIFSCFILVNLMFFVMTLCGEMGVPQSVYERYYKLKYVGAKQKIEEEPEDSN